MSQSERRLAAIMFTDIVGYTALTQQKESEALQILEEHRELLRPIFAKHRGREVKTIGDAFLVEFGSALEATLCAIDIQSTIHSRNLERGEKLQVRVGIHVGDVVHQGGDVLGDAVNVASRIEPLAEPGGICVTEQVQDHVKNKISYPLVKLDARRLKNVREPIDVYRVELPWEEKETEAGVNLQLDRNRIAVLPFANMSPDPNDEYFADGMTEELITAMSGLQGLQVIARTSVMNYKGEKTKLSTIGNDLRVGTVLEGSVRKAGNRVRVTAQLIDVPSESHLWSEKYDRELDDIFKIQDDIAGKIAEALRVRLAATQEPVHKQTENIEAYTLYLKGRSLWSKKNKEGVLESLKLFQEAIRIDPNYARAYAGLADAYSVAAERVFRDRADSLVRAKEAATKALGLDDTLAEAHASLGLNLLSDLRYEEARRELKRAIELNPSYASAHQWYYGCLLELGRMKEAVEEIEKAHELDPLSPTITLDLGEANYLNGKLDDAIAIYDKLIENEPTFAYTYWGRAVCFMLKGVKQRAYADAEAWGRLFPTLGEVEDAKFAHKPLLAILYGWFGEKERALLVIEELIPKVPKVWESAIAQCYAVLGNRDEFFSWVDKGISVKRVAPAGYRYSPTYSKMRDDPRFPEIFKKLGLLY